MGMAALFMEIETYKEVMIFALFSADTPGVPYL